MGVPQRKESQHRFYDDKDIKNLLRIAYLYHSGMKISKIAALSEGEIIKEAQKITSIENGATFYLKELLEASVDFSIESFEEILDTVIAQTGIQEAMIKVIYPFLEKIGLLWLTSHIIPGQEHITSNIICHKLLKAINDLPLNSSENAPVYILFSPENEHHEIPLLLIHFLLKKHSKKVVYFGCNTSVTEIGIYVENKPIDYIIFHIITNLTHLNADSYVNQLVESFPGKKIVVSGPFAQTITTNAANVRLLRSLDEMLKFTME